jgi:uncharacterized protein (UPF0262 family)
LPSDPDPPFRDCHRILDLALDERLVVRRSPQIEHERTVAIYDLIEEARFALAGQDGPYKLRLSIREDRLEFGIDDADGRPMRDIGVALAPFRRIIKDYFTVCESYYAAIKTASPSRIEAIDMGRRSLHNEGSDLLRQRLAGKVDMDLNTARRLFTLICVLHIRA